MNTNNPNPNGPVRKTERAFSQKLFLGLGVAVIVAFVIFLFVRQGKDLKPQPVQEQIPTDIKPPALQIPPSQDGTH